MKSIFVEKIEKGIYKHDFSEINKCKGTVMLEVKPLNSRDKLILNGRKDDLITQENPFKIETSFPIVNGILTFEPYESSANMKTIVRMLLVK